MRRTCSTCGGIDSSKRISCITCTSFRGHMTNWHPKKKEEPLHTAVTRINDRYHCRVMYGKEVKEEMACKEKQDIGYCFWYMLRMLHKCGKDELSDMADASRHRFKGPREPVGVIWYPSSIPIRKKR